METLVVGQTVEIEWVENEKSEWYSGRGHHIMRKKINIVSNTSTMKLNLLRCYQIVATG